MPKKRRQPLPSRRRLHRNRSWSHRPPLALAARHCPKKSRRGMATSALMVQACLWGLAMRLTEKKSLPPNAPPVTVISPKVSTTGPKLAGGADTLDHEDPLKTVGSYWPHLSTAFDYIKRSMPYGNAGTLSDDETYAIVAYILYSNDLIDDDFVLSNETFFDVEMPNADGFIVDDRAETEYATVDRRTLHGKLQGQRQ